MKELQRMGNGAPIVFSGKTKTKTTRELYGQTAKLFATTIKERTSQKEPVCTLADIGSHGGELLLEVLELLPEFDFTVVAVDRDTTHLSHNVSKIKRITANATALPFADNSIDVVIVRYLLQWNSRAAQEKILQEVARVTRQFAILEHGGACPTNPNGWRINMDNLLNGNKIPELARTGFFFASRDELENMMNENNIAHERIRDRKVKNGTNAYIERYGLNEKEAQQARKILGKYNYFWQTDWVIFPTQKSV